MEAGCGVQLRKDGWEVPSQLLRGNLRGSGWLALIVPEDLVLSKNDSRLQV